MNERMKMFYMSIAESCAAMSRAEKLKVGAVIVKNDNILAFSWNGTPSGWDNCCEDKIYAPNNMDYDPRDYPYRDYVGEFGEYVTDFQWQTRPEVIHAETNCLIKLTKSTENGIGSTMFITHAPCINCAKLLFQSGIKVIYYRELYRSSAGIEFLEKNGILVEKI